MLTAAIGGGCASAGCAAAISRALKPKPAPKPAPKSCSWFSVCGLHKAVAKGKSAIKAVVAKGKKVATRTIAAIKKLPVAGRVAAVAISAVSDAYHVGATFVTRTVLPIARAAAGLGTFAIHVITTSVHQVSAAATLLKRAAGATAKAVVSFVKKHPAIGQLAAGAASVVTGMVKGAAAQVTHNIDILGGCATGSLGDCGQVLNMAGTSGMGSAALQSAQGAVTTAGSIYHNLSDGQVPYAAGQIIAIAGIFAVTRGIGAGAEGTGAADAGATANSASWFSRLLEPKTTVHAHIDPDFAPRFFRGARPGEEPSFVPRPNEYKVDSSTGSVRPTHGVSVFDNPASVSSKGFVPYEVDQSTIPSELRIIQRGGDPRHYEIVPQQGISLTPQQYTDLLCQISCLAGG
jgi:hypothetical protein